ncbi:MAG: hypothetical protein JWP38_2752 [Herbaspirillum sp.]|jgi:hypothetical protein|nr:hypothetical protein [Herbaspirillum sp.]
MPQQDHHFPEQSIAARKKELLAAGALYRAKIIAARTDIAEGVRPGALAKSALAQLSETAKIALLDTFRGGVVNPRILSPLLMTGLSFLSKAGMRKPLLYVGVAGGAIAAAIYLKNKLGDNSASVDDSAEP